MSELHMLRNQNQAPEEIGGGGGYSDPRAAFSPKVKEFKEAMSLLYIRNNASGRNKFRLKWPTVAAHIFGEELIDMDNNGTQDRDRRAQLENEAGLRRIAIKMILDEYEDKSVKSGTLEFDYVGSVLDKVGSDIGLLLYAENIIERVRPGMITSTKKTADDKEGVIRDAQNAHDDMLRARSASSAQGDESFGSNISAQEMAEKTLADQERKVLRGLSDVEDFLQDRPVGGMKIEIGEDVRPIDMQPNANEQALPPQDTQVVLPPVEDLDALQNMDFSDPVPAELPPELPALEAAPVVPPATNFEPPAAAKPRLHIAGLRIKDEPVAEDKTPDQKQD